MGPQQYPDIRSHGRLALDFFWQNRDHHDDPQDDLEYRVDRSTDAQHEKAAIVIRRNARIEPRTIFRYLDMFKVYSRFIQPYSDIFSHIQSHIQSLIQSLIQSYSDITNYVPMMIQTWRVLATGSTISGLFLGNRKAKLANGDARIGRIGPFAEPPGPDQDREAQGIGQQDQGGIHKGQHADT